MNQIEDNSCEMHHGEPCEKCGRCRECGRCLCAELEEAVSDLDAAVVMKDIAAQNYDAACIVVYKKRGAVMEVRRKIWELERVSGDEVCPF